MTVTMMMNHDDDEYTTMMMMREEAEQFPSTIYRQIGIFLFSNRHF